MFRVTAPVLGIVFTIPNCSVPALIVVPPVYVLAPDNVSVPAPLYAKLLAAAPLALEPKVARISFSPALLVTARTVVLQALGASKAEALTRAVRGREDLINCPAQWLRKAAGRVVVIADSAAASGL